MLAGYHALPQCAAPPAYTPACAALVPPSRLQDYAGNSMARAANFSFVMGNVNFTGPITLNLVLGPVPRCGGHWRVVQPPRASAATAAAAQPQS